MPLRYTALGILFLRYFAFDSLSVDISLIRYLAIRCYAYSIFHISGFCTFDILPQSTFRDLDILSLDILRSIFRDSIYCVSIFCHGSDKSLLGDAGMGPGDNNCLATSFSLVYHMPEYENIWARGVW